MVITDGKTAEKDELDNEAKSLHARDINVFAVGIDQAPEAELKTIASDPAYVYQYTDFSNLAGLKSELGKRICRGKSI